jgi:geranylgeranyl diphosphate synthase type II
MPLSVWKEAIEAALPGLVPGEAPSALREAMLYSLMAGGKRFRPLLVMAAGKALGADPLPLVQSACALEFIHTYSLIHDDLPAMDNDTLRRGMPTSHVKFGEALAILAGDALNTEAFGILTAHPASIPPDMRLEAVRLVAAAAGAAGMAGGQALDMEAPSAAPSEEALMAVHSGKTARLIQVSIVLGALYAGADGVKRQEFSSMGLEAGLLFQVADDILDETSTAEEMGKSAGKDRQQNKLTAPKVWGLRESVTRARMLEAEILKVLEPFGPPAGELCELIRIICLRLPK